MSQRFVLIAARDAVLLMLSGISDPAKRSRATDHAKGLFTIAGLDARIVDAWAWPKSESKPIRVDATTGQPIREDTVAVVPTTAFDVKA